MAARVETRRVQAAHPSLRCVAAKADWSDEALLEAVCAQVLPIIERQGLTRGWMIDGTGTPKKGTHPVGVARQCCGQLGEHDNCPAASPCRWPAATPACRTRLVTIGLVTHSQPHSQL